MLPGIAENTCAQTGYGLRVQLTDPRFRYTHDFPDFAQIEILLIIKRHHQLFPFGQQFDGLHKGLSDVLVLENP